MCWISICHQHHLSEHKETVKYIWIVSNSNCGLWLKSIWLVTPKHMADSRFSPSQWVPLWLCNNVSHWLGANLESTLKTDAFFKHLHWVNCIKTYHSIYVNKICYMLYLFYFFNKTIMQDIDGLAQDCSNSSRLTQSWAKHWCEI